MDKCWIEYSFPVPTGEIDLISEVLYSIGCLGVNVEERDLDTFTVPDPDADLPAVYNIKAYFADTTRQDDLLGTITTAMQPLLPGFPSAPVTVTLVRQEDWAEGWKQHFSTLRFGSRLVVKPTWEEWECQANEAIVSLDPGMAFGTGSHETTRLCLQALADQFEADPIPRRVLDVGTGSGILAIAAARLGASTVIGCEIDADSRRVANENVMLNAVVDAVTITDRLLEDIEGYYDLVIANILAEENVRLADQLLARLAVRGTLILSGILREREDFVRQGFNRYGLPEPAVHYDADWCCICYDRGAVG